MLKVLIFLLFLFKNQFGACFPKVENNTTDLSKRNLGDNNSGQQDNGLSEADLIELAEATLNEYSLDKNDYNSYETTEKTTTKTTTTSTTTTTTKKTTSSYYATSPSYYPYINPSETVYFNISLVVVWEKVSSDSSFRIELFSLSLTINEMLIIWYYPSINSIVIENAKVYSSSSFSILRLPTSRFERLFFLFEKKSSMSIYFDCPGISSAKLVWNSDLLNKVDLVKLKNVYARIYKDLETALKQSMCKQLVTVYPSIVLHLNTSLIKTKTILLFSFSSDGDILSIIYFNGVLKLISSNGSNLPIGNSTQPIESIYGIYFLFLSNSVQIFTECPSNRYPVLIWTTDLFRTRTQLETSIKFTTGSALTPKLLHKYCLTNYLLSGSILVKTKQASTKILDFYVELIQKTSILTIPYLPTTSQLEKIKDFKFTPGFNLEFLLRPEQRILIASRSFARRGFFDRSIKDYITGFSDGAKNFWIGLGVLNKLTNKHEFKLRIEIFNFTRTIVEEYGFFKVENESENFRLNVGNLIQGEIGYFEFHDKLEFSTFDFGPLRYQALKYAGGFWHRGYATDAYTSNIDNYYCFSCEDKIDDYGSSFINTLSYASVRTYVTRIYLIP